MNLNNRVNLSDRNDECKINFQKFENLFNAK